MNCNNDQHEYIMDCFMICTPHQTEPIIEQVGTAIPVQAITGLQGSKEINAPIFQDNKHMKMVGLSAPRTGLVLNSVTHWVDPRSQYGRKDKVNENSQFTHWQSNPLPTGV
jgi:hypothetical protein